MKRFTNDIVDIKRGDTDINKVYRGENLVWEKVTPAETFVVLSRGTNINVISYTDALLNEIWSITRTDRTWNLAFDEDGDIYVASEVGNNQFVKLDKNNGNVLLTINTGGYLEAIATDKSKNIYLSGGGFSNPTRKYNSTGTLLWSVAHGADNYGIDIDSSGNVYTCGGVSGGNSIRKYDSSGNLIFSRNHGSTTWDIKVDNDDNFIIVGFRISNITTRKYDSNGNLLWSADHGSLTRRLAVDNNNNIYTTGNRTSNITTRKYDSNGNLLFNIDAGVNTTGIDVDSFSNIYVSSTIDAFRAKYDPLGNLITSFTNTGEGSTVIKTFPPRLKS